METDGERSEPQATWDSEDAAAADIAPAGGRPIAGFWRRIAASVIDGLALALLGLVFGMVAGPLLSQLGGYARLLGLAIAVAYGGVLNSGLGGGRTLGKALLRLRVVNGRGQPISLPLSIARSAILEAPFLLYGLAIPLTQEWLSIVVLSTALFGLGGATVYLYLFNWRTRQSTHDLLCQTYVVRATAEGPVGVGPVARVHYAVAAAILLVAAGGSAWSTPMPAEGPLADIIEVQHRLYALDDVLFGTVRVRESRANGVRTVRSILVDVWSKREASLDFAASVAGVVLDTYPGADRAEFVTVNVSTGFDIGLGSVFQAQSWNESPAEWRTHGAQ